MNDHGKIGVNEGNSRVKYLLLILFILIPVLYHFAGYLGHYGFDDLYYSRIAVNLLNGQPEYGEHFFYRWTIIGLTAASYFIFGVSDHSSSLPSLLVFSASVYFLFLILKKYNPATVALGLGLFVLNAWSLFYSDKLMPDSYVGLSVISATYFYHREKYVKKSAGNFIGFSISIVFGILSKGTVILFFPLLIYWVIIDLIRKESVRFWFFSGITLLLLMAGYFFSVFLLTGNPLARFEALKAGSYLNMCSYDQQPFIIVLKRISYEFFERMILQGMMPGIILSLAGLFIIKSRNSFLMLKNEKGFFILSTLILLLSSNFMSISLTGYVPMCPDTRHFLFIIPVAAVGGALILEEFLKTGKPGGAVLLLWAIIAVFSFFLPGNSHYHLYFPILALFLAVFFFPRIRKYQIILIVLFLFMMAVKSLFMVSYARKVNYYGQKKIVEETVHGLKSPWIIITNEVQKRLGEYYLDFRENDKGTYLSYDEFQDSLREGRNYYLLMNHYTRYLSGMKDNELPYYTRESFSDRQLLKRDPETGITVYELKAIKAPVLLVISRNSFEKPSPYWHYEGSRITGQKAFNGDHSYLSGEYSATFVYPFDTLKSNRFYVDASFYCLLEEKSNIFLTVQVFEGDKKIFGRNIPVSSFLKAYGHWFLANAPVEIQDLPVSSNATLKVFIWNPDKGKLYIDDATIKIYDSGSIR